MSSTLIISEKSKTYPFVMDHLPEYFREKCKAELKESPENIAQGLQELKNKAKKHKLLCDIHFNDEFLMQFLRNRKYDVSRAFKHLLKYVTLVNSQPLWFQRLDMDKYYRHPQGLFFTPLPRRCQDGCTIILFEFGKWNPEVITVEEFKPLATTLFGQSIRDPMSQVNGYKIIFDFTGTTFKHLKCFTPHNLYMFYHGVMECLPGRQKQILVIYKSIVAKVAVTIFTKCATQKIKKRIVLKSNQEDLVEEFPPSVLPVHYGGLLTNYHMEDWWRTANEQQDKSLYIQPNYY